MNSFDFSILTYINSFANLYPYLDTLITHTQRDNLIKGGILIAVWWYFWFRETAENDRTAIRGTLIASMIAMIMGLFVARLLAHVLPFQARPLANPALHFVIPHGVRAGLATWSAFPSDHAVVWFSIAACIYLIHKPVGWLITLYVSLLSFGRIYAGIHNPTDILAGAAIGLTCVHAVNFGFSRYRLATPILKWSEAKPGFFYAVAFLCTYQISNMFDEVRAIAQFSWNAIKLFF